MRPLRVFAHMLTGAVLLSLVAFSPAGAKSPEITPHWLDKPIVLDGHIDDWNGLPTTFLEDQAAVVGLANDGENLYVQIRFREGAYARVIHRTGLTLYLDPKGGKNKDIGIKFVGGPSMAEIREASPQRQESDTSFDRRGRWNQEGQNADRMRGRDDTVFTYFDKKRLIDATISVDGANGPRVAWGIDHGFFVYEFAIPLAQSEVRDYGLGLEPGEKVGIGAEWGGRPEGMEDQRGPQFSTGGFGGGDDGDGMMGGGDDGMGPGGGGGMRRERPQGEGMRKAFTKQEFWTKTSLAKQTSNSK